MTRRKQKQLKLSRELIRRLNKIAREAENIEKMAKRYVDPTLYKVVSITAPIDDMGQHFYAILVPLKNAPLGPSLKWDEEEEALTGGFFSGYREHIRIPVKPNSVHLGQIVKITISPAEDETIIDTR
jgi:hypothetical protein